MRRTVLILPLLLIFMIGLNVQASRISKIFLWRNNDNQQDEKTSFIEVFTPDKVSKTRIGIIVCPGGSYAHMMGYKKEGEKTGEWLASQGITAFVLKYRVSNKGYHHPAMIEDFQKTMDYVKTHFAEYDLDTNKIGALGFSAGGHLALMSGVFGGENYLEKRGIKTHCGFMPNFIMAVYPVVSMQDSIAHTRSRKNLLGPRFTKDQMDKFSLELQNLSAMPPVFLFACKDDKVVNYRNSVNMAKSLETFHRNCRFLLYDHGNHGFGIDSKKVGPGAPWTSEMIHWLDELNMLN